MMGSEERGVPICVTTSGACAPRLQTLNEIASPIVRNRPIATALHFVVDGVRTLRDVVIDVVTDVNRLKPLSVVQRWLGAASSSTAGVRAVCCSYGR